MHATKEELWETMFTMLSVPRLYNEVNLTSLQFKEQESRVEVGSNTSTVAMKVVGGDEKGSL
jgi:hypothetical protein